MAKIDNEKYDIAIIGSGLGGLQCGYILAKHGYKVAIFEKNHQIGGSLQVFSRQKTIFDTGVHYLGGLDKGQNLHQFFRYFGMGDHNLKLRRLDINCYDRIEFMDNDEGYSLAQGYENFANSLKRDFPEEGKAIDEYCRLVREFCSKFKLYNLEVSGMANYMSDPYLLQSNAYEVLDSLSSNKRLTAVLGGNMMLYGGHKDRTPFFVHALVTNSYVESSYRIADGGSQIAIWLSREIRKMGGQIFRRKEIVGANVEDKHIKSLVTAEGEEVFAKNYISNLHPHITTKLIGEDHFKKAYKKRIGNIRNTVACFCSHFVLKENAFDYLNYNIYQHADNEGVWNTDLASEDDWPASIMISTPANSKNPGKADGITAMTFMEYEYFQNWGSSFNTVTTEGERGANYEQKKRHFEGLLLQRMEERFPGFSELVIHSESSTPLTFRDYLNTPDGSSYGMQKDCDMPLNAFINPKTNVKNLFLTGQNVVMHGILGVTVGAFITCFHFVDKDKLIADVRNS